MHKKGDEEKEGKSNGNIRNKDRMEKCHRLETGINCF
jgi:hypothetical protein